MRKIVGTRKFARRGDLPMQFPKSKLFHRHRFGYHGWYPKKSDAEYDAKLYREINYNARIVKIGRMYVLYLRKK